MLTAEAYFLAALCYFYNMMMTTTKAIIAAVIFKVSVFEFS